MRENEFCRGQWNNRTENYGRQGNTHSIGTVAIAYVTFANLLLLVESMSLIALCLDFRYVAATFTNHSTVWLHWKQELLNISFGVYFTSVLLKSILFFGGQIVTTKEIYQIFSSKSVRTFDLTLRSLIRIEIICDVLRQSVNCLFALNASQSTVNSDGG